MVCLVKKRSVSINDWKYLSINMDRWRSAHVWGANVTQSRYLQLHPRSCITSYSFHLSAFSGHTSWWIDLDYGIFPDCDMVYNNINISITSNGGDNVDHSISNWKCSSAVLINITQWYADILGVPLAWWTFYRFLWVLMRAVRDFWGYFIFEHLLYPTLISRISTCTTPWFQPLLITSYIIGNVICISLQPSDIGEYSVRATLLSVINLAPLGICGRTNPIAPGWRLSYQIQVFRHSWIGRVVIVEALFHCSISLWQTCLTDRNTLEISGCMVTSPSALILCSTK